MILSNELRIGNVVMWNMRSGNTVKKTVDIEFLKYLLNNEGFERIDPILLTPEILEKCGFIKDESSDDQERPICTIQIANNHSLYYDPENPESDEFWYISLQWNNNHYKNSFWQFPEYLHQLQNLYFALTGEELKVNL